MIGFLYLLRASQETRSHHSWNSSRRRVPIGCRDCGWAMGKVQEGGHFPVAERVFKKWRVWASPQAERRAVWCKSGGCGPLLEMCLHSYWYLWKICSQSGKYHWTYCPWSVAPSEFQFLKDVNWVEFPSPGKPHMESLVVEGSGHHSSVYSVKGRYVGGKEGPSSIQWFRTVPGSDKEPDAILGETGLTYEATADDVGFALMVKYTPVREDGEVGQPVTTVTQPITIGWPLDSFFFCFGLICILRFFNAFLLFHCYFQNLLSLQTLIRLWRMDRQNLK